MQVRFNQKSKEDLDKNRVIVRVWSSGVNLRHKGEDVGHVSIYLEPSNTYISLWPQDPVHSPFEVASPKFVSSYEQDLEKEGRAPEKTFYFYSLNSKEMKKKFDALKTDVKNWYAFGDFKANAESCASCALKVLLAGKIDKLVPLYQKMGAESGEIGYGSYVASREGSKSHRIESKQAMMYSTEQLIAAFVENPDALITQLQIAKNNELVRYAFTDELDQAYISQHVTVSPDNFMIARLWKPKVQGEEVSYPRAVLAEVGRKENAVVGHISLEIFNQGKTKYFSHWPDFNEREKREREGNQAFFQQDKGKNNSLVYDLENEGAPDAYYVLYGLNTEKMLQEAEGLGETCNWTLKGEKSDKIITAVDKEPQLKSFSCSSYVYELLKSGNIHQQLLINESLLSHPISPKDVGALLEKASQAEAKLFPQTQSYLKTLSPVQTMIRSIKAFPINQEMIDYVRLYTQLNPHDPTLVNQLNQRLKEYHAEQLLQKIKIDTYALNKKLKGDLDYEIFDLIDKEGANPFVKDKNGYNALYYAVINRNYKIIKTILEKYPNAINHTFSSQSSQLTTSMTKEKENQSPQAKTLLELATELKYGEIQALLVKMGAKQVFHCTNNSDFATHHIFGKNNKQSNSKSVNEPDRNSGITNLVWGGGGVAGYAYAGVVQALSKIPVFDFNALQTIAGTSIGAITALILALKYTPEEAIELIEELDLKLFRDGGNLIKQKKNLFFEHGRYLGNELDKFIKKIIKGKIPTEHPEDVTFYDLKELGFLDLSVTTSKICNLDGVNTQKEKIFSTDKTPLTSVLAAVRASAAAPYHFTSVKMKKIGKGHYIRVNEAIKTDNHVFEFIDGGVLDNYPIDIFDNQKLGCSPKAVTKKNTNPHTLGFALLHHSQMEPTYMPTRQTGVDSTIGYVSALIRGTINQNETAKLKQPENLNRTVEIDRLGVDIVDFDISDAVKEALKQSGRNAVINYFTNLSKNLNLDSSSPSGTKYSQV